MDPISRHCCAFLILTAMEINDRIKSANSSTWLVNDLSSDQSQWIKNPDNTIQQTGDLNKDYGSILILEPNSLESDLLSLQLSLPSEGQFGLAFHFSDDQNFSLFHAKRKDANLVTIEIVNCTGGSYSSIFSQDFDYPEYSLSLTLIRIESNISFQLGEEEIYIWEDKPIPLSPLGLYNNKSKIGLFNNLIFENLESMSESVEGDEFEPVLEEEIEDSLATQDSKKLEDYLKISAPKSETQVEFDEVFTVPLDSFYVSLFRNYGEKPIELQESNQDEGDDDGIDIEFNGDAIIAYDLSPSHFLVISAKGIKDFEKLNFPFQEIYTGLYSKSDRKPIREFRTQITTNELIGKIPVGEDYLFSLKASIISEVLNTTNSSNLYSGNVFLKGFSNSGNYLVGIDAFRSKIVVLDSSNASVLTEMDCSPSSGQSMIEIQSVKVSNDTNEQYVIVDFDEPNDPTESSVALVYDRSTGDLKKELTFASSTDGFTFSNNGSRCLIKVDQKYILYKCSDWTPIQQFSKLDHYEFPDPKFTPDSKYLVFYKQWNSIQIRKATDGAIFKEKSVNIQWAVPIGNTKVLFYNGSDLGTWDFSTDSTNTFSNVPIHNIKSFDLVKGNSKFLIHDSQGIKVYSQAVIEQASFAISNLDYNVKFSDDGKAIIPFGDLDHGNVRSFFLDPSPVMSTSVESSISNIDDLTVSNDGKTYLVIDEAGDLHIWDAVTGTIKSTKTILGMQEAVINPNSGNYFIRKFSVEAHQLDNVIEDPVKEINIDLRFLQDEFGPLCSSPDGSKLMFPGALKVPSLWNFETQQLSNLPQLSNIDKEELQVTFAADGERVIATENQKGDLTEFNISNGTKKNFQRPKDDQQNQAKFVCICYDSQSDHIFTYLEDKTIRKWTCSGGDTDTIVFTDPHDEKAQFIGVSPDNSLLYLIHPGEISIHNTGTGDLVHSIHISGEATGFQIWFTPDSNQLTISNFQQVYTERIRRAPAGDSSGASDSNIPSTFSYLLDYRPKRWYRNLKKAYQQEVHFNSLAQKFNEKIESLRSAIFNPPPVPEPEDEDPPTQFSQIRDGLQQINEYQIKYKEATSLVDEALDAQQAISGELRLNGYNLVYQEEAERPTDPPLLYTYQNGMKKYFDGQLQIQQELKDRGYSFAIIGGRPKVKEYQPFALDPKMDFGNDADWNNFWGGFRAYLLNHDALSEEKKAAFVEQSNELFTVAGNKKIQGEKGKLEKDIQVAEETIRKLGDQEDHIDSEITKWEADRSLIQGLNLSSYLNFHNHINSEKPKLQKLGSPLKVEYSTWGESIKRSYTIGRWFWKRTITLTYHRTNYRYVVRHNESGGKGGFYTGWSYATGSFTYNRTTGINIHSFKAKLISICDASIRDLNEAKSRIQQDINKFKNEVRFHENAMDEIMTNGMTAQRKKFIAYWNDPNQFGALETLQNEVMPEADPLADLLVSLQFPNETSNTNINQVSEAPWKTDFFQFSGDRFYNEEGLTLQSYLEFLKFNKAKRVAIFPKMEDDGTINDDAFIAVINPKQALNVEEDLPVIKFVETYRIGIEWKGYNLGELSHTENLFPNESKEIKIERTIKLVSKQEESRADSQISSQKSSSSFEENLSKEVSLKETSSQEIENTTENNTKSTSENTSDNTVTKSSDFNMKLKFPKIIPGISGGLNYKKKNKQTKKDTRKNTLEKSQKQTGKTANKESREAFSKDTSNTIRKVANETSQENKVEIKVSSTEELSTSDARTETVNLENPNMGRTVNYQFFQIQNGYNVKTTLTDVKIVVDMNEEIIKGSTVTDMRVFNLEEFGKIFQDEQDNPRYMLTSAIIARQAFKNYLSGVPGISRGNGALRIPEPFVPNMELLEIVNFSKKLTKNSAEKNNLFEELNEAMAYLKQVPFEFQEKQINLPKDFYINAGAYYLEAEVGNMAATEKYLEDRRDIETNRNIAELNHLKKQTSESVFFPPIAPNNEQE